LQSGAVEATPNPRHEAKALTRPIRINIQQETDRIERIGRSGNAVKNPRQGFPLITASFDFLIFGRPHVAPRVFDCLMKNGNPESPQPLGDLK
jgi:hypothetical protein